MLRPVDLLEEQLALRLAAYRSKAPFRGHDTAEAKLRGFLGPIHELGEVRVLRHGSRVEAAIAWRRDDGSWFGPPVYTVAIDQRSGADVEGWLAEVLAEVVPTLDADLDLLVDAQYRETYRALGRVGVGVDSIQLIGDVERAARELRRAPMPEGVRLERLTVDHVEPILALYAETFAAEPEYCWFGAHPSYLSRQREKLEATLASPGHLELVLLTERGPRGHASATVDQENAFWGPTAGMSLCFAPELRGRGVLRPVYGALLDGMRERGAVAFKGGTSQPAVMRLGLEMGRVLQGVNMKRHVHFDEAHFAPYLPLR
ncbi:MAG: hypothetical protein R3B82_25555 [Sandaracinaceae bacterium]